jgi:hypothetical protein
MIPNDAYARLQNAYVFRERTKKRIGSRLLPYGTTSDQLLSRLRINIGTTDGSGNVITTVPLSTGVPIVTPAVGQLFSIGSDVFTVNLVTPAAADPLLKTGSATLATFDTRVGGGGTLTINGASATTDVYYYPSLPVMGFPTYELAEVNDERIIAFDTRFAYQRIGTGWERISAEAVAGDAQWSGSDSNFFFASNYRGANSYNFLMWVTNNTTADGIRYYNGTQWASLVPVISGANTLQTALIILPFKGRLIALNPVIGGQRYVNRAQFSIDGDLVTAATSWLQTAGKGGYIEASTKEAIVGAGYLHDRLIVFFERSTWEFLWTGNYKLPFAWRKINTELGCESTFSPVAFDKAIVGIGNVGIHACNGASVERIDEKIPEEIFRFQNTSSGPNRVYGVRDFNLEMVYWAFPDENAIGEYPNKMLVYNYANGSWALNDDSITCFGHWQKESEDTWENDHQMWQDDDTQWNKGALQKTEQYVLAGNQEGFTFYLEDGIGRNSPSLQVTDMAASTNIITVINHNLASGDFIFLENIDASDPNIGLNDKIYQITYNTKDTFILTNATIEAGYLGGATLARVSRMDIWTKEFSFYVQEGNSNAILHGDFFVEKTTNGQITINLVPSGSQVSLIVGADGTPQAPVFGTGILETNAYADVPLEEFQDRFWHTAYFGASGETVQLRLSLSDEQMLDSDIATSDFTMHAFILNVQKIQMVGG